MVGVLVQDVQEEQDVQLKLSTHKRAFPEIVIVNEFVEGIAFTVILVLLLELL